MLFSSIEDPLLVRMLWKVLAEISDAVIAPCMTLPFEVVPDHNKDFKGELLFCWKQRKRSFQYSLLRRWIIR